MAAKVLVAMSGGVDSSVAAYILEEQGYACAGTTMILYDRSPGEAGEDVSLLPDVADARDAARRIGIPHYVFDLTDDFRLLVVEKFVRSYREGLIPNPCIDCNRSIKFGYLQSRADELGADYIATGHYARIVTDPVTGRKAVAKARDLSKDQSYVLSMLTQEELSRAIFPLGEMTKEEVRGIARRLGLSNAARPDSQDICFIPDGDTGSFLADYPESDFRPGDILDTSGRVIGRHLGAARYTIGQRRGLGISSGERLYVCAKSIADNTVTLGPEEALYKTHLTAGDIVWGVAEGITGPTRAAVRTRYRQPEQAATIYPQSDPAGHETLLIEFDKPMRAVTPGQTAVIYREDTVLAAGTILLQDEI